MKLNPPNNARSCFLVKFLSLTASLLASAGMTYTAPSQAAPLLHVQTVRLTDTAKYPDKPLPTLDRSTITFPLFLAQATEDALAEKFPWVIVSGSILLLISPVIIRLAGLVIIQEKEVGIVIKKFASRTLPSGKLVALNGEAGY